MKKLSKKQLFAVLLTIGLSTGGNCFAKDLSPQKQELQYRIQFFKTLRDAFKTIIEAPAVYVKKLWSIEGLDKKTKEQYAKNTTKYINKFSGLLKIADKKLADGQKNARKQFEA